MKKPLVINVEELKEEPYASILCYPKASKVGLRSRLEELGELGIKALEFTGEKEVLNTPVLGKGCVGIVTIAYRNGEKTALKIRRVDADRSQMQHEAEMLRRANSVNVGPKFLCVSENLLLMQLIEGDLLPQWLEKRKGKVQIRKVLREILRQCWRLDKAGVDHGELSYAPKHIIVDEKNEPCIVDFETASINRKPSNVTSICQFLFISGVVAKKVVEKLGEKDRKTTIEALRLYKSDKTCENLERVIRAYSL